MRSTPPSRPLISPVMRSPLVITMVSTFDRAANGAAASSTALRIVARVFMGAPASAPGAGNKKNLGSALRNLARMTAPSAIRKMQVAYRRVQQGGFVTIGEQAFMQRIDWTTKL